MDIENAILVVQLADGVGGGRALEVLHIVAYFATEDIDTGIFLDLLGGSEKVTDAVELLKHHSLIQSGEKETTILIEKEVQEKVREILREQEKEESVLKAAFKLLSKFLVPANFNHAISMFSMATVYPKLMKEHSSFPSEVILGLMKEDRDLEALNFAREVLSVFEEILGEYHPSAIAVQRNLGLALMCVDKTKDAVDVLIEVYKKITEVKGEKKIGNTLTLIAKIMSSLTPEPESRLRRLVFGDVPVSETNNNSILKLWCEYALMLKEFKWIDEAFPILVQVLEKRRQLLHPDDDDICDVEDTIGYLHLQQKNFQKALEIFQKVYEIRKNKLGENCVKTIYTRRGIAYAYESLDMLDKALVEIEAVAEKLRQILGEDDSRYLVVLGKVAYIFYRQNEHEKAFNLFTRLYDKFVAVKGEKDTDTLNVKHNLGSVLLDQGKTEEALSIFREVLEGYFEVLGPKHSDSTELMQKVLVLTLRTDPGSSEKILNLFKNR